MLYFPSQPFGEIHMIQLKKRPGSGESKGFGFIRFVDKEVEKKVNSLIFRPKNNWTIAKNTELNWKYVIRCSCRGTWSMDAGVTSKFLKARRERSLKLPESVSKFPELVTPYSGSISGLKQGQSSAQDICGENHREPHQRGHQGFHHLQWIRFSGPNHMLFSGPLWDLWDSDWCVHPGALQTLLLCSVQWVQGGSEPSWKGALNQGLKRSLLWKVL